MTNLTDVQFLNDVLKPKSRLLIVILTLKCFVYFSSFKSRLRALIKKVYSRSLIYLAKILVFHLILSCHQFRVGEEKFSIQSIFTSLCSISTCYVRVFTWICRIDFETKLEIDPSKILHCFVQYYTAI